MNKQEFRKLIREEIRKVLKEASINDINDSVFKNGWGYTFNVDGNINTIVAYNASGRDNLKASDSLDLNSVKNLKDTIGSEAVKMIEANFVNKAKKITKANLSNSDLVIVTDHNVSDPIFITQTGIQPYSEKPIIYKLEGDSSDSSMYVVIYTNEGKDDIGFEKLPFAKVPGTSVSKFVILYKLDKESKGVIKALGNRLPEIQSWKQVGTSKDNEEFVLANPDDLVVVMRR